MSPASRLRLLHHRAIALHCRPRGLLQLVREGDFAIRHAVVGLRDFSGTRESRMRPAIACVPDRAGQRRASVHSLPLWLFGVLRLPQKLADFRRG